MSRFVEMEGMDGAILVEVDDNELSENLDLVGIKDLFSPLSSFVSKIVSNGKGIISKARELSPDEIELEFGIKGGVETGSTVWGLAKAVGEGNIKVKLKWKKENKNCEQDKEKNNMTDNYKAFSKKFRISELLVCETEYWKWSLRPVQVTIGSGVLSLKRPAEHFSDITEIESADLSNMIKIIEDTLSRVFGYLRINYLMLMMVDYQVHFHVIPRYSVPVSFEGKEWADEYYPKPVPVSGTPSSDEELFSVLDAIKASLPCNKQ